MALTPGSKQKLNILSGFGDTILVSESNKIKYADKVFEYGMTLYDENGYLYHTDGIKTLQQLLSEPVADKNVKVLTAAERKMITDTNQANGLVHTDDHNKIDDAQLYLVEGGKLKDSYLSEYVKDGMIKLSVLPPEVRKHMKYIKSYDLLESMTEEDRQGLVFVIDATGDETVKKGWAIYAWCDLDGDNTGADAAWHKVQEGESLDYDFDSVTTHDTVEQTGAVMYDHVVEVSLLSLDQLQDKEVNVSPSFERFEREPEVWQGGSVTGIPVELSTYGVKGEHDLKLTLTSTDATSVVTININEQDLITEAQATPVELKLTGTVEQLNTWLQTATVTDAKQGGTAATLVLTLDDDVKTVLTLTYGFKQDAATVADVIPTMTVENGSAQGTEFPDCNTFTVPVLASEYPVTTLKATITPADGYNPYAVRNYTVYAGSVDATENTGTLSWADVPDVTSNKLTLSGTFAECNAKLAQGIKVTSLDASLPQSVIIVDDALKEKGDPTKDRVTITLTKQYTPPKLKFTSEITAEVSENGTPLQLGLDTTNVNPEEKFSAHLVSEGVQIAPSSNGVDRTNEVDCIPNTPEGLNSVLNGICVWGSEAGGTVTVTLNGPGIEPEIKEVITVTKGMVTLMAQAAAVSRTTTQPKTRYKSRRY